eukprot:13737782-Alexandrium_andersonii.AAC.1
MVAAPGAGSAPAGDRAAGERAAGLRERGDEGPLAARPARAAGEPGLVGALRSPCHQGAPGEVGAALR